MKRAADSHFSLAIAMQRKCNVINKEKEEEEGGKKELPNRFVCDYIHSLFVNQKET